MTQPDLATKITPFGIGALRAYIIVVGSRKVEDSPISYHHEYDAEWDGDKWVAPFKGNEYTFKRHSDALEFIEEEEHTLREALKKYLDSV